ncbi:MAG: helix-turn-helix domain-containing protein [Candidatus Gastranaerophilales bacterium]|nr:helix-turn-helix domain-containing protein [Candidatus Gastranaerophilales bacterium]
MNIKELLGKRIREYRIHKKMTQYQLAEKIGIDGKHLSSIELGKNMPNPQIIVKLSEVFGVEVKDLFEFYHLQKGSDLKEYILEQIKTLDESQLEMVCKYIRSFVL